MLTKAKTSKPTAVEMVPIFQLYFAADAPKELGLQVRKSSDEEGLPTLEASIRAHGVIVPLVVKRHKGKAYVTAGNRRLRMLRKIHGDLDVEVPVVDSDAYPGDPREIAMATNVALPPHPIDRYEIIAALVAEGMSPDDAKLRFGMSDRQYNQIMKLGTLAPSLRDKWRDGEIDGAVAQALTMSDNPEEQEKVYATAKKGAYDGKVDARQIKSRLVPDSQRELGRLVEFIGVDEIEKAGLIKQRDWFASSHIVTDPKAVKKMAVQSLSAIAAELVNKQGWSWAVGVDDIDRNQVYSYGHVAADKSGNFTDEQKKKSGCILEIGYDGKLKIDYGRIKPSERKKVEGSERRAASPAAKAKAKAKKNGDVVLTISLAERLSTQLQNAGAEVLKMEHAVAVSALIASFASGGHVLAVSVAGGAMKKKSAFADVFSAALKSSSEQRSAMLAQIAAQALSIVTHNPESMPLDDEDIGDLFEAMNGGRVTKAVMGAFDAKDYFSSIGREMIVKAVLCSMGASHADKVAKMDKAAAAKFATANVPGTGYLPKPLRTVWYTGPEEAKPETPAKKPTDAKKPTAKKTAKKKSKK